jgi:hypothetical protein
MQVKEEVEVEEEDGFESRANGSQKFIFVSGSDPVVST